MSTIPPARLDLVDVSVAPQMRAAAAALVQRRLDDPDDVLAILGLEAS